MDPFLQVTELRTHFESAGGTIRAVDGITFEVRAGETLALVGESGCGKSVTALSIMRLVARPGRIVSGEIHLDGKDLLQLSEKEMRWIRGNSIAMIFQDPMSSLNPVLPVGRQIAEALQVHLKLKRSAARRRAVELLDLVGIPSADKRVDDYPHQFSGGMRQRVMIATALSCEPKLIIADEITTALDVTTQAQILELLKELSAAVGTATILITHDLGIVARMADRAHVMYAGQIVEKANVLDLYDRPMMPYTWGLLGSMPRLDEKLGHRLTPIDGTPPQGLAMPPGCRFAPRCRYSRQICGQRVPDLVPAVDHIEHETRCWGTQDVPEGGWLRKHDWRGHPELSSTLPESPSAGVP